MNAGVLKVQQLGRREAYAKARSKINE